MHRLRALVHPSPRGDPLGSPGRSLLSLDASERFKTMTKKPNQNSQYIWPTMSSKLCRAQKKPEGSSSHYKARSPKPVPRGDGCTLRLEFFTGVKVTTLLSCSWLFGSPVIWLDLLLLFPLGNCSPLFCVSSSSCSGVASLTGCFDVLGLSGAGSSSTWLEFLGLTAASSLVFAWVLDLFLPGLDFELFLFLLLGVTVTYKTCCHVVRFWRRFLASPRCADNLSQIYSLFKCKDPPSITDWVPGIRQLRAAGFLEAETNEKHVANLFFSSLPLSQLFTIYIKCRKTNLAYGPQRLSAAISKHANTSRVWLGISPGL